jgi:uncharacterized protein
MSEKYWQLLEILKRHERLAVAFSGGVDSTLLLRAAIDALGSNRVMALTASSCLESRGVVAYRRRTLQACFPDDLNHVEIPCNPLGRKVFWVNTANRCYECKKYLFSKIFSTMEALGYHDLADGTNADDLATDRPGLRAIKELGVYTPLAELGLTKKQIRQLAKDKELINHDLNSESCLATRIPTGETITGALLKRIEEAENFMKQLGFTGPRVRYHRDRVELEIREDQFRLMAERQKRDKLSGFFKKNNISNVLVKVLGRE